MNTVLILNDVRAALQDSADEKTKNTSSRFFKEGEEIYVYGVKANLVHKIAKEGFKEINHLSKEKVFALCEELWKSDIMEEINVACDWSYFVQKSYQPEDFKRFERWVASYVNNWASCDSLCNHTVGEFVEMYPQFVDELKRWAKSDNRWMKRAAAVTLIIPARKGLFLKDIFEIADIMLMDPDDMVQKGYGWMLKAASEAHQEEVFEFVMERKDRMPRTSLRYAIEKMPADMKARAMAK
ncbi:DNA alkylation repair protein [Bacteroides sp. 51]|uniref:DNA alkylation repair protein n=1 Tax=Bacteroides sp. 51 TaxID=2302938 RepID=UPI0013D5129D|nr:DNA alkylation repair protein [Bacteroides sp. 51]NDV81383.1 DNA alkylation repair protein [Bacteroides sp. 51]